MAQLTAQERGVAPAATPQSAIRNPQFQTRAVIVGISDYQDEHIPDLRFAHRDATAFAAYLQSAAGGTLPPENIKLLTNKAATTGAIASAMDWLIADCQPGDRAIIYFSGHGDVETRTKFQRGFLLTYDSPPSNYLAGAFALIFLQDIISTLADQGVQVVMISDACRAGKLTGSVIGGSQATAANLSKQFANEIKILSCQPDEFSLEGEQWGGGRGCFSYHLIDGLTGMADGNTDNQVNLLEIGQYLQMKVPAETDPQSQIPLTVGSMKTVLTDVDETSLLALREQKEKSLPVIATIETKGFEQVVLAGMDSSWQKKYAQFTAALEKGELLEPPGASAYDLYVELSEVPELERLHGIMKRNLATALQDESQQAINAYLRADEEEMAAQSRGDLKYTKFVRYLEKAADLLGEQHYMYKVLKAKHYYFDAVDIRVRFEQRTFSLADSAFIWKKQQQEKIQKAIEMEENAAFIQFEKGTSVDKGRIQYYEKAIELAPAWVVPYAQLVIPLVAAGKMEEAESYAAKVMALAPESSLAYSTLGWLQLYKKENEKAEELFLKAVQISPRNVLWLKYLAAAYNTQQQYRDAEKTWLRILEISPEDNETYNALSGLYGMKTFEYDKAEAINRIRLEKRPTDGDAYSDLISIFWASGQPEKIKSLVGEMEKIDASVKNWEGHTNFGKAYRALGEPEKAIPYYQRAINVAPQNIWHYYGLAGIYFELGEYEKGLACLDSSFANGMNPVWVEDNFGVFRAFKSPGFKAFAQRAMDKWYKRGFGYSLMGKYYEGQADLATATDYYKKATVLSPERQQNWINYGCTAYLSGQKEKADSIFNHYMALNTLAFGRLNDIGIFYKNHGEFKLAEPLFIAAIKQAPAVPEHLHIRRNLARLYYFFGKKQEAFAVLEEAKKIAPDDLNTTALVAVLRYFDEPATAKSYFDEIIRTTPEFSTAWDCLEAARKDDYEQATAAALKGRERFNAFWTDMIKYRYLLMRIRQGAKEEALMLFTEILEKGWFVEYQLFSTDPGLDPIRDMEDFQKLMNTHFPEKAKN